MYIVKCSVAILGRCIWNGGLCDFWKTWSKLRRQVMPGDFQFDFKFCICVLPRVCWLRGLPQVRQHFEYSFDWDVLMFTMKKFWKKQCSGNLIYFLPRTHFVPISRSWEWRVTFRDVSCTHFSVVNNDFSFDTFESKSAPKSWIKYAAWN